MMLEVAVHGDLVLLLWVCEYYSISWCKNVGRTVHHGTGVGDRGDMFKLGI